ncbi:MAG: 1-acyl-sn-glycerol-3-phosphate acyltransferase [Paludibacteraceae bacterium]|nr:1-acyl-sn-glycerol-3-phosphate acyltransferase [Paludibacteraceae bacterium]
MKEINRIRAVKNGALLCITDRIIVLPVLRRMVRKTADGLELLGTENISPKEGHLFLTNHRDIVLDSSWLTLLLREKWNIRPYIGIGNNLFGKWWIEPFVRFNRCFVVIRDGNPKDRITHATILGQYIRNRISERHSVWLAEREGRSKDGNDLCQPAVLKMLTMGEDNLLDAIKALNICPVSISYEFDPCDYLKAREMQLKRDNPEWKKSKEDDLLSMRTGIYGKKGHVVFHLTPSINTWIDEHIDSLRQMPRNNQLAAIAQRIDFQIHSNYHIFERNESFDRYLRQQIDKISVPDKDNDFLLEQMKNMYLNPVINYEKSHLSGEL